MGRNRYVARAHLSEAQFRSLVRLFALDLEATKVAALTGLSRRTVNKYFRALRVRMARACERHAPPHDDAAPHAAAPGEHVPRTRRRAPASWTFGVVVRHGQVYTEIVNGAEAGATVGGGAGGNGSAALQSGRYDAVISFSPRRHTRILRGRAEEGARTRGRIDRVESFWSVTKARIARRRGIRRAYFPLHLKESEFRFNHREADLYRLLLDLVRQDPIK